MLGLFAHVCSIVTVAVRYINFVWLVYAASGDTEFLAESYPAMRRCGECFRARIACPIACPNKQTSLKAQRNMLTKLVI